MTRQVEQVDVTKQIVLYRDVRCDGCNKKLEPGFGYDREHPEFWGARNLNSLWPTEGVQVEIRGNYPSQWDDYGSLFLLCDACVDRLRRRFPGIGQSMDKWRSQFQ